MCSHFGLLGDKRELTEVKHCAAGDDRSGGRVGEVGPLPLVPHGESVKIFEVSFFEVVDR